MPDSTMQLFLFTTDLDLALKGQSAGIDGVVVDWEFEDKQERQVGWATEINRDSPEDVARLAGCLSIPVMVRINRPSSQMITEVETALSGGAGLIMLPMAESPREVEKFLRLVDQRARTVVQIETLPLVDECSALRDLEWDFAYVGLNDLMISRRSPWLWEPLLDGMLEQIYGTLEGRAVGFGGVTIISGGHPVPFADLLREMARLGCRISFLRRSFKREIVGRDVTAELRAVRAAWADARQRDPLSVERDHEAFLCKLQQIKTRLLAGQLQAG